MSMVFIKRVVSGRPAGDNGDVVAKDAKAKADHLPKEMMALIVEDKHDAANAKPVAVHALVHTSATLGAALSCASGCLATVTPLSSKATTKQALKDAAAQLGSSHALAAELLREARAVMPQLAERDALLARTREQNESAARDSVRMATMTACLRDMLAHTAADKLAERESRDAKGGRFNAPSAEEVVEQLSIAVGGLVDENQQLWEVNSQMTRAKADMAKRVKELGDKAHNETELLQREVTQLRAQLKKAEAEATDRTSMAKGAAGSEAAKKGSEAKELKRRMDMAKAEAEHAKAASKTAKAAADAAQAAMAKSEESARAAMAKAFDAKAARDVALRDIDTAGCELAALAAELKAARNAPPGSVPPLVPTGSAAKYGAPWPRTAFTTRGGRVLHGRACAGQDTTRCVTLRYEDHAALEAYLKEEGAVLCRSCCADPGF